MNVYKENRSLSPHLRLYKPQVTSVISIFHRITGSLLGLVFLCFPICFSILSSFVSFGFIYNLFIYLTFFLKLFFYVFLTTFFFHSMNGLRHIMWDLCIGLELSNVFISGCIVVSLTMFLSYIFILL